MEILKLLLAGIGGAIASGLLQFLINERKYINERNRLIIEKEYEMNILEKKKTEDEANYKKNQAGKLLKILYQLDIELSLTKNYILETIETNQEDIHESYLKQFESISDAFTICLITFPDLTTKFKELSGIANMVWGARQNYFGHSKNNEKVKDQLRMDLITQFNKVPSIVHDIENSLLFE